MKTPALALALIASFFVATAPALRADSVLIPVKDAVLTGNIITNPVTPNAKVALTPLTKANLLALFHYFNVSPGSTAFFVDTSNDNIVLGTKDGKTAYVIVLAAQLDSSYATASGKSGNQGYEITSASFVGTDFTGNIIRQVTGTPVGNHTNVLLRDSFSGYGTIDGAAQPNAIISGTFHGTFSVDISHT